ncbi:MAG: hypothetical protein ABIQ87_13175 [Rubrivivax sp.]
MADAEAPFERVSAVVQELIVPPTLRHHQMCGECHIGRAHWRQTIADRHGVALKRLCPAFIPLLHPVLRARVLTVSAP